MTIFRPRIGNSTFRPPSTHIPRFRPSPLPCSLKSAWFWAFAGKRLSYGRIGPLSSLWGRKKINLNPFVKQRT